MRHLAPLRSGHSACPTPRHGKGERCEPATKTATRITPRRVATCLAFGNTVYHTEAGGVTPLNVITLQDGSTLVLTDVHPAAGDQPPAPVADGTLSTIHEVQAFVAEAVAAGITFDVLKAAVRRLGERDAAPPPAATADQVRSTVEAYFLDAGYDDVRIAELRRIGSEGWTVDGNVDGESFRAISDASARVVHIRLR